MRNTHQRLLLWCGGLMTIILTFTFWDRTAAQYPTGRDLVQYSPDGQYLARVTQDGTIRILSADATQVVATLSHDFGAPDSLSWHPSSTLLVVAWGDAAVIRAWDIPSGQIHATLSIDRGDLALVAWNPSGTRFVSLSLTDGGPVTLWNYTGVFTLVGTSITSTFYDWVWSPDGNQLLLSGFVSPYLISNIDHLAGDWLDIQALFVTLDWSSDGQFVAGGTTEGQIYILDTATWEVTYIIEGVAGVVSYLEWSPNGAFLASINYDKTLRVWDMRGFLSAPSNNPNSVINLEVIAVPNVLERRGNTLSWRPDGAQLVYSDGQDGLRFLNLAAFAQH